MFSYVDRRIREKLARDHRLVDLDKQGRPVDSGSAEQIYLTLLGPIPLPREVAGELVLFDWWAFVRRVELDKVRAAADRVRDGTSEAFRELIQSRMTVNTVLALPGFAKASEPLVRVHSSCLTGDVFASQRCECGPQLQGAFERLVVEGQGAVVYMASHEGRGIGLWAKAITYLLQDDGYDTYQANTCLGLPEDSRDFTDAAVVLGYLRDGAPVRLLTNNPLKVEHLRAGGQQVSSVEPLVVGVGDYNRRYMHSKRAKGHYLPEDL